MSSLSILSPAASALSAINIHPHSHKKGSHVEATNDSGSDTAAQIPAGTAQNLFGSLLRSLEQVIGVQSSAATSTAAPAPSAPNAASSPGPAGSNVSVNA